ncbi:hypothetical protein PLESTF_000021000 [Pleodorina starrii]|nr:hypothetical protein PLESTF_000021000 [Pleodorina starrii]
MAEACAIGVDFDTTSAVVRPLYPGNKKPLVQIACIPDCPEPRMEPPDTFVGQGACSRPCGDPMAYLEDAVDGLVKPPTDTGPAHTMWSAIPAIAVIGVAEAATQEHTLNFVKRTMEGFGAVDDGKARTHLKGYGISGDEWTNGYGSELVNITLIFETTVVIWDDTQQLDNDHKAELLGVVPDHHRDFGNQRDVHKLAAVAIRPLISAHSVALEVRPCLPIWASQYGYRHLTKYLDAEGWW